MEIRRDTISYSAQKKRDRISQEQLLNHEIETLENNISSSNYSNEILSEELKIKKDALELIYKYQAQGAYVRSRTTFKVEGERPTRFFCSLEKYNGVQKFVNQLIVTNEGGQETLLTNQKEVEGEIFSFYENLYQNKDMTEITSIETFLDPQTCENAPKLSESQKFSMKGKISLEEMTKYLKKTKNNVSPGSSGFTNDFYKFFWRDLKQFVVRAVDFAFDHNRLSATQSLGIISIIPKGDKDKRFLTNWRPLTLLNTLYKLISGCIAERIKPVLPGLINPDQKGFVAGRYIGEAIRTTYDIMDYAKQNNTAGLILLIDFEKAYDSISFRFINKCLNFFNFDEDILKWIHMLLNNFSTVINHCGNISPRFEIGRGCRQGDPIASYLFILCIEILALKLRSDDGIKGFKIGDIRHLMEIYADDLTVFMEPCGQSLRNAVNNLTLFYKLSGLKINLTKTKAIWFGSAHNSEIKLCPDLKLKWVKTFTLLGLNFDNNLENMQQNFTDKIELLENMLSTWSYRYLTPFGKVTIVKSLGLSKLSHVALVTPNPTKETIKRIENIFYQFIWNRKSEKVKRDDCKLPIKLGGLGMIDVSKFWTAFKFSWFRRLLSTEAFWPKILLENISTSTNLSVTICELLSLGASKISEIAKKISNPFWKQVLGTAFPVASNYIFCHPEKIIESPFFFNPQIVRRRPINFRDFPEISPASTMADFLYPGSNIIMEWNDYCTRYNIQIDREKFIDIRYTLKAAIQKLKLPQTRLLCAQYPQKPLLIDIATLCKKGCSSYYKILTKKEHLNNSIHKRDQKWHLELNSNFSNNFWDRSRALCATIDCDNQLKWLQFQINRKCLQTNHIVSHFIQNVSPVCSYCENPNSVEKISHLFWLCPLVNAFLENIFTYINSIGIEYSPNMVQFIFGYHNKAFYQPQNFISLLIKKYIWINKFKNANLSMASFKNLMKTYVSDLKHICTIKTMPERFTEWNAVFEQL